MRLLKQKNGDLICDLLAVVCGAALFTYLFATANRSMGLLDEAFYYTVPQRILQGDRFFIDEWHLTQLAFIFNIIPYRIFTAVSGGTEGLILFMRYFYLGVDLLFYVFMYCRLRRFRFAGLCGALLFCGLLPQGVCSLCYYTVSAMAFASLCLLLMTDPKERGPFSLFVCGVILACGVLAEPLLVFVFLIYVAATAVCECMRRKRPFLENYAFLLNRKSCLWILLGAAASFAAFMAYLLFSGTLRALPSALPYLRMDEQFTSAGLFDPSRLKDALRFFGALPLAGLGATLAAAVFYALSKKKDPRLRIAVFAAGCLFASACYIRAAYAADFLHTVEFHEAPVLLWGPVPYLLCKKRNSRFGAALASGLLFTLFVDLGSANVLGSGGKLVFLAAALCMPELWKELRAASDEGKTNKKKRSEKPSRLPKAVAAAAVAVFCLFFTVWNLGFVYIEGMLKPQDTAFLDEADAGQTQTLTRGPYKGIVTSSLSARYYELTLDDLDRLKAAADGAPVAVPDRLPYAYLYLGLPYAAHSAWVAASYNAQLAAFWQTHPARLPAYLYVPAYNTFSFEPMPKEELLQWIGENLSYRLTEGGAGYILEVTGRP